MAFINKKEEVIQIKLTQFGKEQLSKGRLLPCYYAFFDDDIIYDAAHAGVTEEQNDIVDRIKDSLRLDLQHVTKGVESNYITGSRLIEEGERGIYEPMGEMQETEEKEKILTNILGASHHGIQEAPYYTLETLGDALIKNENLQVTFRTGSSGLKVPQVEFRPEYKIYCDRTKTKEPQQDFDTWIDLLGRDIEFLDGSTLHMDGESLIFSLTEDNAPFVREGFEYELFEINSESGEEKLISIEDDGVLFEINKEKEISDYAKHKKKLNRGFFNT